MQVAGRRALQREKQLVEQEVELRERVLAIVSHDLRNPLNAISMAAALLQRGGTPEARDAPATRIVESAARMARLIDELVDYARVSRGGELLLRRRPGDVAAVARQAVDELRLAAGDRDISLEATGDASGAWDTDRLGQLVSNLVGNAVQHGKGRVDVRVRGEQNGVALSVHNAGAPIPPDVLPFIFEPYRQGRQARPGEVGEGRRQEKSLGLGLYIARQVAHAHGGSIEVRSPDADGTTFFVWLPRSPSTAGAAR